MAKYGLEMSDDRRVVVTWRDDEGEIASAELDPNSADVKAALSLIRKVIWGGDDD